MIVSVQRGMSALKERLEQFGYSVVYSDEYAHPVDAFIYNGHNGYRAQHDNVVASFANIDSMYGATGNANNSFLGLGTAFASRYGSAASPGCVEINAAGKNFEEIEAVLSGNRRTGFF